MTSTITRRPTTWPEHAACRGVDPELFAPRSIRRDDEHASATAAARRYCARCPVRDDCAAEADRDNLQGLWGGVHRLRDASGHGELVRTPLLPIAVQPTRKRGPR